MKATIVGDSHRKSFVLIFDSGDEVIAELERFARENGLRDAHLTAIGAFSSATFGYFEWEHKRYKRIPLDEQVEVLAMTGNIVSTDDGPKVHAHAVVAKADGTAHGGHVLEAIVRPTLEVVLEESPKHLHRRRDPQFGMPLIELA